MNHYFDLLSIAKGKILLLGGIKLIHNGEVITFTCHLYLSII
jgi:hypothetical protein